MGTKITYNSQDEQTPIIEVYSPDNKPEIFVDGLAGMAIGYPNTKLDFTSTVPRKADDKPGVESRIAVCTIVIPTTALLDIRNIIDQNLITNREFVINAATNHKELIERMLALKEE
jgi:hypothetical protein